jgi:hypothetical protein
MGIDLKPCPMCAGPASIQRSRDADNTKWLYVECRNCGCRTRGKWTTEECAIFYAEVRDEWNTRAESSPQAALVPEVGREEPVDDRTLFESIICNGNAPLRNGDGYDDADANSLWWCWRLARESVPARPAATPEAVSVSRAVLEALAIPPQQGFHPHVPNDVIECRQCLRYWLKYGGSEHHAGNCAYVLARAALSAHGEGST